MTTLGKACSQHYSIEGPSEEGSNKTAGGFDRIGNLSEASKDIGIKNSDPQYRNDGNKKKTGKQFPENSERTVTSENQLKKKNSDHGR